MFSVIIPLYNEQKNIINLLDEIKINLSNYEKYEIVLIDDGSDDDTLNTIKLVENIKIKILENKKNLGQSFSIHTGIKYSSFNIIITIDGDGQNDPIDINNLLDIYLSNSEIKLDDRISVL